MSNLNIEEAERAIKAAQEQLENAKRELAEAKKADNPVDILMRAITKFGPGTVFKLGYGGKPRSVRFFVNWGEAHLLATITNANGYTYPLAEFAKQISGWGYTEIFAIDRDNTF